MLGRFFFCHFPREISKLLLFLYKCKVLFLCIVTKVRKLSENSVKDIDFIPHRVYNIVTVKERHGRKKGK